MYNLGDLATEIFTVLKALPGFLVLRVKVQEERNKPKEKLLNKRSQGFLG